MGDRTMVLDITGLESREWLTLAVLAMATMLAARGIAEPRAGRWARLLSLGAGGVMVGILIAFSLLVLILIFRPSGILGEVLSRKKA